jgi:hypothetical protein
MKYFRNFKEAHEYYEYPSTHRVGTIGDSNGVIRSYSNGKKGDIIKDNGKIIYYKLKNEKIKNLFKLSLINKKKLRFFKKDKEKVIDMGEYVVSKFYKDYVKLIK